MSTGIPQNDDELISGNDGGITPNDLFQDGSNIDTDDPNGPVKRGQSRILSLPVFLVPVHQSLQGTVRSANGSPTGDLPHLTPGAQRIENIRR